MREKLEKQLIKEMREKLEKEMKVESKKQKVGGRNKRIKRQNQKI